MQSAVGEINYSKTSIHSPNDIPRLEITMPDTCTVQLLYQNKYSFTSRPGETHSKVREEHFQLTVLEVLSHPNQIARFHASPELIYRVFCS